MLPRVGDWPFLRGASTGGALGGAIGGAIGGAGSPDEEAAVDPSSFLSMSSLMAGAAGWERYPADAEVAAAEPVEEDAAVEDGFSFLTGAGC